jgi:hypothetical protein
MAMGLRDRDLMRAMKKKKRVPCDLCRGVYWNVDLVGRVIPCPHCGHVGGPRLPPDYDHGAGWVARKGGEAVKCAECGSRYHATSQHDRPFGWCVACTVVRFSSEKADKEEAALIALRVGMGLGRDARDPFVHLCRDHLAMFRAMDDGRDEY